VRLSFALSKQCLDRVYEALMHLTNEVSLGYQKEKKKVNVKLGIYKRKGKRKIKKTL
jgi:hypothetical protein